MFKPEKQLALSQQVSIRSNLPSINRIPKLSAQTATKTHASVVTVDHSYKQNVQNKFTIDVSLTIQEQDENDSEGSIQNYYH